MKDLTKTKNKNTAIISTKKINFDLKALFRVVGHIRLLYISTLIIISTYLCAGRNRLEYHFETTIMTCNQLVQPNHLTERNEIKIFILDNCSVSGYFCYNRLSITQK